MAQATKRTTQQKSTPSKKLSIPQIAVVIVSYNTAKLTQAAVKSALASTGVNVSVFVVDNASSDRTMAQLRRNFSLRASKKMLSTYVAKVQSEDVMTILYPGATEDIQQIETLYQAEQDDGNEVVLLASRDNLGFGRANNMISAATDHDYVFYLNSDATLEPDALAQMVKIFRENKESSQTTSVLARAQNRVDNLGILAAELHNQDGSLQLQGGALPNLLNVFFWITFLDDVPFLSHVVWSYQHHIADIRRYHRRNIAKVGWVGGTACMTHRRCLDEIGGFDPAIFMYGEDVEWCWRATKRHWDVAITNQAKVMHLGSASAGHKRSIHGEIEGLLYMWQKHRSRAEYWMLRKFLQFGIRLRVIIFGILRRYGQQRIYQEALELVR